MAPSTKLLALVVLFPVYFLLEGCSGCSRSGGRVNRHSQVYEPENHTPSRVVDQRENRSDGDSNEVLLEEESGVYKIPVVVNDVPMKFIFDTGASLISISETEASFLYKQGTLTNDDFIEQGKFSDANGDISEGTIVRLKSVIIGNKTLYNVRAVVISGGHAPLLLGQSALAQFGRVSVDYSRKTVTFD